MLIGLRRREWSRTIFECGQWNRRRRRRRKMSGQLIRDGRHIDGKILAGDGHGVVVVRRRRHHRHRH